MASEPLLRLAAVSKHFPGGIVGLDTVDLTIGSGEFVSLLGPSGCGKTTTLRVIAGFEGPTAGSVLLDGKDITGLRPYDRPVNTVFQDYALFPHMDVSDNIGFGLSLRGITGADAAKRIKDALELVGLSDKIKARVQALSGGQRQRVALARAIVCEPRMLLLDEPLSALDAHLREQMQMELKSLQARLGTTFVMVTHDQTEALSISDRIIVMNKGRIEQDAGPAELYDRPATRFVARFIGTMNLVDAEFKGAEGDLLHFSAGSLPVDVPRMSDAIPTRGQVSTIGIRPEDLVATADASDRTVPAKIASIVFHGRSLRMHVDTGAGRMLTVDQPRQSSANPFSIGDTAHIKVRPGANSTIING